MENALENMQVLLVEDHHDLADAVVDYLENSGFVMDYAPDGLTGMHLAATQRYDAIILDVMLPVIDGFNICQKLRKEARLNTPIIMLTARDQLEDKLQGFQEGADDYLVKPFDMPELEMRLRALIRRTRGELDSGEYQIHDLLLDTNTMQVQRQGQTIRLSPTCLRILRILMRESPKVVSREALEQELWGDLLPDSDTLRSHIYNLRKAVDKPFTEALIRTLPGIGFQICAPNQKE